MPFFFEKNFFDMLKIKRLIKKLKNNIENKFGEVKNHKKISRRIIINSFKYFISFKKNLTGKKSHLHLYLSFIIMKNHG
jgi:hypothetical protein